MLLIQQRKLHVEKRTVIQVHLHHHHLKKHDLQGAKSTLLIQIKYNLILHCMAICKY
jgi:hypothetical protein